MLHLYGKTVRDGITMDLGQPLPSRDRNRRSERHVLVVDDDPDVRRLTRIALRAHGMPDPAVASDGGEALQMLRARGLPESADPATNPSLIILDLQLPKMHGLEVIRQIRLRPEGLAVPVVVFSSRAYSDASAKALAAGASEYVRKPVDFHDFVATVQAICDRWLPPVENHPSRDPMPATQSADGHRTRESCFGSR